jgi:hypothetical protein
MWSSFRVGQRAKTTILSESEHEIIASHDGYKRHGIIHKRTFTTDHRSIVIRDEIIGGSKYPQKAYLHFHSGIELKIENNMIKTDFANIFFDNFNRIEGNNCTFSEEFSVRLSSKMITVFFDKCVTTTINFLPI